MRATRYDEAVVRHPVNGWGGSLVCMWLAACSPTIELGSNATPEAGTGGTDADSATTTGAGPDGTTRGTTSMGVTPDPASSSGSDTGPPPTGDTTSADSGTDGGSTTGAAQSCRDVFGGNLPCLMCAEAECCDEIDLCLGQPECDCFIVCVEMGTPPPLCQAMCDPASGAAALTTCLMTACTFDCTMP